jgi:hexosaminidase
MSGRTTVAAVSFVCLAVRASAAVEHDLMPVPARMEWGQGALPIDRSFHFVVHGPKDARVDGALGRLASWLQQEARLPKAPSVGGGGRHGLRVEWQTTGLPVQSVAESESYTLQVGADDAHLQAPNPLGVLRGLETFRQLVTTESGAVAVRAASIEDAPRFPWRGLLVDPARRWQPIENIKRTLDAMAAVKMNVLHWHLSEDQGFRIESVRYPGLHERGSDGAYYTEAQVRDVLMYARARGIRIVPEFDMPGHTTSWLVGHPELGSAPGPYELIRKWGVFDNSFDPTSEAVFTFVDRFIEEMAALFPDEYLHIGGDEVTPRRWNENTAIQEFAYAHGLRDAHDLQAHFNKRVSDILTRHNKKMVGWDEILHPDLPRSIVVHSWRGSAALAQAAAAGYDGILSNGYYLDHMQPAARHYLVDPLPATSTLTEEARRHVLGGEACMWGEFVSAEMLDGRVWPRAAAVAERLWSKAEVRDVDDMYRRLARQSERLEALGLTHRTSGRAMLQRLVGEANVEPLATLGATLEPVKGYGRLHSRSYTQNTPLTRLVDAVRPESEVARRFRRDVETWISAGGDDAPLRRTLSQWAANHTDLAPTVASAPDRPSILSLSQDLSAAAAVAIEALDVLGGKRPGASEWFESARRLMAGAATPRAEVELAATVGLRKLVWAAGRQEMLRVRPRAEWNAVLDQELAAARPSRNNDEDD